MYYNFSGNVGSRILYLSKQKMAHNSLRDKYIKNYWMIVSSMVILCQKSNIF